jgi:hypothetical protein
MTTTDVATGSSKSLRRVRVGCIVVGIGMGSTDDVLDADGHRHEGGATKGGFT